jgi:hypothetical protein
MLKTNLNVLDVRLSRLLAMMVFIIVLLVILVFAKDASNG